MPGGETEQDVQGWLLSPRGPLHRRVHGDRASCGTVLRGAVACPLLAAQAWEVPVCVHCFPAGPWPYERWRG